MPGEEPVTSPSPTKGRAVSIIFWGIIMLIVGLGVYFYFWISSGDNQNSNTAAPVIATEDDPFFGNENSPVVVVEFSDFQCPYCLQSFPVVRQVLENYQQDIKFIYRDFPLIGQHPQAQKAAEAGACAAEQDKFWEMHDKMFINQSDLTVPALKRYAREVGLDNSAFIACLDSGRMASEVQEDLGDGLQAGVAATPTFFFNGRKFEGTMTYEQMSEILDSLIAIYNP